MIPKFTPKNWIPKRLFLKTEKMQEKQIVSKEITRPSYVNETRRKQKRYAVMVGKLSAKVSAVGKRKLIKTNETN